MAIHTTLSLAAMQFKVAAYDMIALLRSHASMHVSHQCIHAGTPLAALMDLARLLFTCLSTQWASLLANFSSFGSPMLS